MNTIYNALPILLPIAILLIGFFTSQVNGKMPDGLISQKEIANKWLSENTWTARFSILFLPLIFLYNLIVWVVFGLISLFDFISFLFKKLWWLLLFMWNEVLHPTIFWAARLIWHYPIGFSWRFFEFSFKHIAISLKISSISYSVKKLLKIGFFGAALMIIYFIYPNFISLILGSSLFVLYFQYAVFQSISNFKPEFSEEKNKPSLRMIIVWIGVAVFSTSLLLGTKLLNIYAISALGVTLTQILIPILFLVVIALLSAITCLAPYFQNVDKINTLDFLKAILFRLPKLIFAQPFQLIGLAVVGVIPFFIVFALNFGTSVVTGKDFFEWKDEVITLKEHLPDYRTARKSIKANNQQISYFLVEKDSVIADYKLSLNELDGKTEDAEALKNKIQYNKINTFEGNAYVGETQFFSIPEISNCAEYKWTVKKDGNVIYEQSKAASNNKKSSLFYFYWRTPGQYTVSLTPTNRCGNAQSMQTFVNVLDVPKKAEILRPTGKTEVCEFEELTYRTDGGYDYYEWRHPFGETNTTSEVLTLTWGNLSGTIQVRGVNSNGGKTLWRGTNVMVKSLPFTDNVSKKMLEDEKQIELNISRDFIFPTIEEAQDSINKIASLKESLIQKMDDFVLRQDAKINSLNDEINSLQEGIWQNIHLFLGKILVTIGLVLVVSLLLSTIFSYLLLFHFDLFNFKQEDKHYWEETLSEIRLKNPQQPLLGIFILITSVILVVLFIYLFKIMNPPA